jgi:hypothetical protein
MRRVVRSVPRRRRYLALAILALVGATLALTSAAARTHAQPKPRVLAVTSATDSCGYPTGSGLSATTFNESTVLKGFTTTNVSPFLNDTTHKPTLNVFYSDEWELNLGVDATGGDGHDATTSTDWRPTFLKSGTTNTYADDAGTNPNDPQSSGTNPDRATVTTGTGTDPETRPKAPVIFVTKVAANAAANTPAAGDWQQGGTAQSPSFIGGMWKADGAPHQGQLLVNNKATGTAFGNNGSFLGPHADAFSLNINGTLEKYGAETRYDVLGLKDNTGAAVGPGKTYKVQMMIHDGDHVSDTGEACRIVTIPKAPSKTITHPDIKVAETININVDISTNASASVQPGDTVTVQLIKRGTAPNSTRVDDNGNTVDARGCTSTNQAGLSSGTAAQQQGDTVTFTIGTNAFVASNGDIVDANGNKIELIYPNDFGANAPALTPGASPTGDYWWFVKYTPGPNNDGVAGSNDDCTENFNINFASG